MPTNADMVAKALADRGVPCLFGLPGGEVVPFIDACRKAGIRFVLTGHEASAAWIAQVYGQITGIPGACCATLGPGATNLATGIANAYLDRAPVVAATAQIAAESYATMTHQRIDLDALFASITKATLGYEQAGLALEVAAEPRPGPVYISLAKPNAPVPSRREGNGAGTGAVNQALRASQRPLILIGLGATPVEAPAIRALIDRLQAPFLVTPKAKGIAAEDHPLFLGIASGMCIDRDILDTIRAADLVLAIGFDPVECDKTWFATTNIVSLDSASMAEGSYQPVESIGSIATLVSQLETTPKPWPADLLEQRRAAILRTPTGGLSPLRMIQELRAVFPRDGIVATDVGSHKLAMGQFWRSYEPGTFFMSNGLSGMGFGIPAAIAAQLAHPEKHVMAVVGDGGMLMMMHDLVLIRELGLPIVIVVFVDRSLSLIRVSESRKGIEPYGVDFCPPDFAGAAQAFGMASHRAIGIEDARDAVEQALSARKPSLIEVPIDHCEYYDLV
jgi:acetolactate synthase-1/2/3 large subunit